jgi:hypothetical protein
MISECFAADVNWLLSVRPNWIFVRADLDFSFFERISRLTRAAALWRHRLNTNLKAE